MHGPEQGQAIKEALLVDQFNHPERIDISGTLVSVVDIAPQEGLKSEIPTIVVPGFSATPEALKDTIIRIAEAGRRVISADAAHGVPIKGKGLTEAQLEAIGLPRAELRKLELILGLLEAKGLSPVNVVGHSEASIYVLAAAALAPEKFRNIVLVEPAGLIGADTVWQLGKRVLKDAKEEKIAGKSRQKVEFTPPNTIPETVLPHLPASIAEIRAIANSDVTDNLARVHGLGIGVSIIHGVDDQFFPMERVQQMVKDHMIDGLYSVEGTHNAMYLWEPYGRVTEQALSALENRHHRSQ